MSFLNDELLHAMSEESYDREFSTKDTKFREDWIRTNLPNSTLNDTNKSGFDAVVFRNDKDNQVVIAYRGTEPDLSWGKVPDIATDGIDVVGGRYKTLRKTVENNPDILSESSPKYHATKSNYENNQFYQAEKLYREVKEAYPTAEISTTGHSLGGALAQYTAIHNNLSSTTYNPASIRTVVSDEILKKIDAGEYDKKNTAYVNPGDGVGAGFSNTSTRHAANTIMINKTYEEANRPKIVIPLITKSTDTSSGFSTPFWKNLTFVSTTLPSGTQNMGVKLFNSFGGEKAHGLENFEFDKNGFITNTLYTRDGEVIGGNPRYTEYINTLLANEKMKDTVNKLIEKYGANLGPLGQMAAAGAGVTIQLSLENLQRAGQKMQQHVNEFQSSLPTATNAILRLIESSDSRSLEPIVDRLTSDLRKFSRWYEEEAHIIAEYINTKAEDFRQADEG
ncbi:lipase family protein [Paenibacillus amylolyticus]|uniref:lipase family protein n=1 Tax=Paenibacillus amylolyticus TaxID=1451 RepID=UPI003390D1EE